MLTVVAGGIFTMLVVTVSGSRGSGRFLGNGWFEPVLFRGR